MIVNYNLCKRPTSFDFAAFCVFAGTVGAKHVHFQLDGPIEDLKYPAEMAWKRFGNIMLPITKLARLTWDLGTGEQGEKFPRVVHNMGNVNNAYLSKARLHYLRPTKSHELSGIPYATITLRDSFRGKTRNSNKDAWARFQKDLEASGMHVIVFPECEDSPIDLETRMSVYCGALMNFGVNNGPMTLCMYSQAPYIVMKQGIGTEPDEALKPGDQFAFAHQRQRLVWEDDSYENIKKAWETFG